MGREKGNKVTASVICMLTASYTCKPGKSEKITVTDDTVCSFYTHGHFTHCGVCYKEQ